MIRPSNHKNVHLSDSPFTDFTSYIENEKVIYVAEASSCGFPPGNFPPEVEIEGINSLGENFMMCLPFDRVEVKEEEVFAAIYKSGGLPWEIHIIND